MGAPFPPGELELGRSDYDVCVQRSPRSSLVTPPTGVVRAGATDARASQYVGLVRLVIARCQADHAGMLVNERAFHRRGRGIQIVWAAGFLVGATSHILDLAAGGVVTYAGFPPAPRAFWVSLTLVDPLAVVLVLLRRRAGVLLGLAIILSDITVNWTVYFTVGGNPLYGVVNQSVFAAILLATAVPLWRWMPSGRSPLSRSVR